MAEPDGRDYRIKWLEEQLRHMRGTIECLDALVQGLNYELRVRDIRIHELREENALLCKRLEEQAPSPQPPLPPFVKLPAKSHRHKKPGRKKGHEAALRPPPPKIDRTVKVPLPQGGNGRPVCPHCRGNLCKLRQHRRIVEDFIPAHVQVTCYRTHSGYCRHCKKRVESRTKGQPPAADLPHAQLGINALATAAVLRVEGRLPFRQVTQLLSEVTGLKVCAGAVARQVQRISRCLAGEYQSLKVRLRSSPSVNGDETGWRNNGQNQWLWTVCDPRHTLFHVDRFRGGEVIRSLLGEAFGGVLGCDFYTAYDAMNCKIQRCHVHLLRELRETADESPAFASHLFCRRCKRLVKDMLRLKARWDELDDNTYTRRACRLEDRLEQLAKQFATDPDANVKRIAARLLKCQSELTPFLWDKQLDGTNNAAERALRPAVVFRKITGGSRSTAGADAWATLASVLRTARQQGRNLRDTLSDLIERHWSGQEPGFLASG